MFIKTRKQNNCEGERIVKMETVKCTHCGKDISKSDATPCTWEEYNLTWYYCKRCNDGCYRDKFKSNEK